jgi:anti-repressor protein
MSNIQIFKHEMFGELPVIVVNGQKYFGANEVAQALQYARPYKAVADHCDAEGVLIWDVPTNGGIQQKKFITAGNVSRLIVAAAKQSKNEHIKARAKQYEKWVFDDVIPSVHEHGVYMTDNLLEKAISDPDFVIGILKNYKEERQKRLAAEQKVEEQKPLVTFAETCMKSEKSLLVREVAKLCTKQGIKIGERQLWQKLRDWGLVFKNKNEPKQEYMNRGYFEVSQGVKENEKGVFTWLTMRVTPKGQMYIIDRLKKEMGVTV